MGHRGLTPRPRAPRLSPRHERSPRVPIACDRDGVGIRVRVIAAPRDPRLRPPTPVGRSPPSRPVASSPGASGAAAGVSARAERWRTVRCRGPGCGTVFYLCGSCYRGQAYCGHPCRATAQRRQRRRANARHQRSPEGRLDHRDRQRAYRARRRRRVTDVPSTRPPRSTTIAPRAGHAASRPVCLVCGRVWRLATRRQARGTSETARGAPRKADDGHS